MNYPNANKLIDSRLHEDAKRDASSFSKWLKQNGVDTYTEVEDDAIYVSAFCPKPKRVQRGKSLFLDWYRFSFTDYEPTDAMDMNIQRAHMGGKFINFFVYPGGITVNDAKKVVVELHSDVGAELGSIKRSQAGASVVRKR